MYCVLFRYGNHNVLYVKHCVLCSVEVLQPYCAICETLCTVFCKGNETLPCYMRHCELCSVEVLQPYRAICEALCTVFCRGIAALPCYM